MQYTTAYNVESGLVTHTRPCFWLMKTGATTRDGVTKTLLVNSFAGDISE